MRFAYYPGCTAKGSTREADLATRWLAAKVGIELHELVDAGCCGSCEIKAVNPTLHFLLNARILAMAAERDLEILTICDTCQANLLQTSRRLGDVNARLTLLEKLKEAKVPYDKTPRVRHFASILAEEIGVTTLRRQVSRPLEGWTVAPFACCHAFRGPGASSGSRSILDEIVLLTGATLEQVRLDDDCCGFHVLMVNEEVSARASARFLARCADAKVDCVVTTSPLCHTALDIYQHKAEKAAGRELGIPVLHVEQMLALALGARPSAVGLGRHMVSTEGLVRKLPLDRPAAIAT